MDDGTRGTPMDWKPPTGAGEFELRKTVPMGGINALQSSHYPNRVSYWITSTQFQRLGGISTVYSKRDIIGLPCEPRAFMTYVDVMSENPLVYCVNPLGPQAISVTNWIFQEQLPPLMLDHIRFVRSYINWAQHPRPSMISENIEIHRSLFFFLPSQLHKKFDDVWCFPTKKHLCSKTNAPTGWLRHAASFSRFSQYCPLTSSTEKPTLRADLWKPRGMGSKGTCTPSWTMYQGEYIHSYTHVCIKIKCIYIYIDISLSLFIALTYITYTHIYIHSYIFIYIIIYNIRIIYWYFLWQCVLIFVCLMLVVLLCFLHLETARGCANVLVLGNLCSFIFLILEYKPT